MGVKEDKWDHLELHTTFWLVPGNKTFMLRANHKSLFGNVITFLLRQMGLNSGLEMATPILTWQERVLYLSSELYSFKQNFLFLIHFGDVPNSYSKHQGLLWECGVCGKCSAAKKNMRGKCKLFPLMPHLYPGGVGGMWDSSLLNWKGLDPRLRRSKLIKLFFQSNKLPLQPKLVRELGKTILISLFSF